MKTPGKISSFRNRSFDFLSTLSQTDFRFYLLKCVLGASLCYGLYVLLPGKQLQWSIISILLVLAPDHHDSVKLAVDRIKANMIGAGIGLVTYLVRSPDLFSLWVSILLTVLFCTFIRLGNASRSALAALIIVLIQEKERGDWVTGLERMVSVAVGCLAALLLTFAFSPVIAAIDRKRSGREDGPKDGDVSE